MKEKYYVFKLKITPSICKKKIKKLKFYNLIDNATFKFSHD